MSNLDGQIELIIDEAVERVESASNPLFLEAARKVVEVFIANGFTFTADDIWDCMEDIETTDNRAMGAVVRPFAKRGLIKHVGYRKTKRPESHGRAISIWRPV